MVDFDGESRGAIDESAAGMKRDDSGEVRQFVEVRLRVLDFASADLLPDRVRELGEQDFGRVQVEPVSQQPPGFLAQRLRNEPLDGDAGVDGQFHRSRSSRSRTTLSV
jgi:hypothetical protein